MLNFPPERIICLTEETVETLYLLGEQDRIVGVTGYAVRPPIVRKEKERVAAFTTEKIDKIIVQGLCVLLQYKYLLISVYCPNRKICRNATKYINS